MYNLAEFKEWLEANPELKGGLQWTKLTTDNHLKGLIEAPEEWVGGYNFRAEFWQPYQAVALKWKAEIDQRERERERGK